MKKIIKAQTHEEQEFLFFFKKKKKITLKIFLENFRGGTFSNSFRRASTNPNFSEKRDFFVFGDLPEVAKTLRVAPNSNFEFEFFPFRLFFGIFRFSGMFSEFVFARDRESLRQFRPRRI